MKRKLLWWIGPLGLIVLAYLFWTQVFYPHYHARYRLTIEVETPDGLKTGSSVIEAVYGWQPTLGGLISSVDNSLSGEAVWVDLSETKKLIVTLTTFVAPTSNRSAWHGGAINALSLPSIIFGFNPHHKEETNVGIALAKKAGPRTVKLEQLPTMVTLSDPTNPQTILRVDPRDLAARFGSGYRIRRATIEMTDAPLTDMLESRIPSLFDAGEPDRIYVNGQQFSRTYFKMSNGKI